MKTAASHQLDGSPTTTTYYALGGGRGHLCRAMRQAQERPHSVIFHQCAQPPPSASSHVELVYVGLDWDAERLRASLVARADRDSELVVDTFPEGVGHELDHTVLATFGRATLVQRYVRPGAYRGYDRACQRYTRRVLPYQRATCEWEGAEPGEYVGAMVRPLLVEEGAQANLVVLGDRSELPVAMRAQLPADTHFVDQWFDVLPAGRRYLSIGAGHNIVYELLGAGVRAAFMPLERRYDDQFRRVGRLGMTVSSAGELARWLEHTGEA